MATSYLYTCTVVPIKGRRQWFRGLGSHEGVPLLYKILMLNSPRLTRSAIWDHDIGILADRRGAYKRAMAFCDKLAEGDLPRPRVYHRLLEDVRDYLWYLPEKYMLLEAAEIYDLAWDFDVAAAKQLAELEALLPRVTAAIAGGEKRWMNRVRATWPEKLGLEGWTPELKFMFKKPPPRPMRKRKKVTASAET